MNIQFDAQLLLDRQKTGISWTALRIIEKLINSDKNYNYGLNFFNFLGLSDSRDLLSKLGKYEYSIKECNWFGAKLYKLLYNFIPIPYKFFYGHNADITHFFNYHVPPGVEGKVVTMVYDTVYKVFPETMNRRTRSMLNLSMNRSCNRADTIITISQFSKSEIVKYLAVPKEKIVVMPCGVDFEFFRPDYSTEEIQTIKDKYSINSDYILYLGTLEPRKNIEKLIDAYQLLKSRNNDIPKLVIAGRKGWQYNSIFQKVNEYRLINDIIFTGYLSEQDTPVLMKGAHAFVFPSIYEGFGMPPLEAMACGTPVITSNVASLPEVVGDAALLVNPFSVESIAEAIGKIIQDECLRTSLSQKGLIHASSFSWDRSAKIVLDVYNNLLS